MNYPTCSVIGLTLEEARKKTNQPIIVTKEDGQSYFSTCDYIPNRMNVELVNGKIRSILKYG